MTTFAQAVALFFAHPQVFMASQMDSTVMNVRFILQSSSYSAQHMQGRVDAFLPMLEKKLEELDQTEFKKQVGADHAGVPNAARWRAADIAWPSQVEELAKAKLEKPKRLSMEASRYWREIIAGTCVFDRPQREVEVLATLEPQDLRSDIRSLRSPLPSLIELWQLKLAVLTLPLHFVCRRDFFRTYMADASTRKLLSIHVRGNKDPGAPAEGDGKAATAAESNLSVTWGTVSCAKAAEGTSTVPVVQIADPWLFKRSQSLYPSPK